MKLNKGDKIGIIACSNPLNENNRLEIEELFHLLKDMGLAVIVSPYLYDMDCPMLGRGKLCAEVLMGFYRDKEIKAIFDVSGGNAANEILDYLEYEDIRQNPKPLFGYSDLTSVLNGIYCKTDIPNILYQVRNICKEHTGIRKEYFYASLMQESQSLYDFSYTFIQGNTLEGIVVGGNIRCFLKLSGTLYLPDMTDKILFLESRSGDVPLMISFLNQLKQIGAFQKVKGIILGTFTEMEKKMLKPEIAKLVVHIVNNKNLPIVKTDEVGHSRHSAAITIGGYIKL